MVLLSRNKPFLLKIWMLITWCKQSLAILTTLLSNNTLSVRVYEPKYCELKISTNLLSSSMETKGKKDRENKRSISYIPYIKVPTLFLHKSANSNVNIIALSFLFFTLHFTLVLSFTSSPPIYRKTNP